MSTRATVNRLLNDGTISDNNYYKFHKAVHYYFKESLSYIQKKFPMNDDVICNSVWTDFNKGSEVSWDNVELFVDKYKSVKSVNDIDCDKLYDEFIDYQTLSNNEIPNTAFDDAKVVDGTIDEEEFFHYRMDILWWHLSNLTMPNTSAKHFKCLPKLAEMVLVLPLSNAELERLFSAVRKNKTDSRSFLKLDGNLSSVLAMKSKYPESRKPCFKWEPDNEIIKCAKSATINTIRKK